MTDEIIDISEQGEEIEEKLIEADLAEEEAEAAAEAEDEDTDAWGLPKDGWLECLPWDGEEASLPAGEQTRIPNFQASNLVRRWIILDAEEDEGFRLVGRKELQPDDILIGAQINEFAVNKLVETYGPRFYIAYASTQPGVMLDRGEWKEQYGTDVLVLQALKQMRRKQSGGGIRTG